MTADRNRQAHHASERRNVASGWLARQGSLNQTIQPGAPSDFLDETIAVWQPYADHALTREDAREIAHNVVGFFGLLREWAEEEHAPYEEPKGGQDTNRTPRSRKKDGRN